MPGAQACMGLPIQLPILSRGRIRCGTLLAGQVCASPTKQGNCLYRSMPRIFDLHLRLIFEAGSGNRVGPAPAILQARARRLVGSPTSWSCPPSPPTLAPLFCPLRMQICTRTQLVRLENSRDRVSKTPWQLKGTWSRPSTVHTLARRLGFVQRNQRELGRCNGRGHGGGLRVALARAQPWVTRG